MNIARMKKILLLTLCCIAALTAYAQGDLKARMEFEQAETAFAQGDYQTALTHVNATEKLLKTYAPRISYLKIVTLDMLCDYTHLPNPYFVQLQAEVKRYLDYADRNQASVVMDKFREVYDINGKMEREQNAQAAWAKIDPSDASAVQLFITQYQGSALVNGLTDQQNMQIREIQELLNESAANVDPQVYRDALAKLESALASGNLSAAMTLGDMYRGGYGVKSNYTKALEYYNMAAKNGDTEVIRKLADFYRTRLFDDDRAIELYKTLAERGDTKAMCAIGRIYYNAMETSGRYYKKHEPTLAIPWFEKAAALGDADALANLIHAKYSWSASEVKTLYQKPIEMGSLDGLVYLAQYLYYNEYGMVTTSSSEKKAKELALKAADAGNASAMYLLSSIYMKGIVSTEWLAKAVQADTDISDVYYFIGIYYADGLRGLSRDKQKAIPWLRLASRMGNRSLQKYLYSAAVLLNKLKVTDNPNETFDELRTSALKQLLADIVMKKNK